MNVSRFRNPRTRGALVFTASCALCLWTLQNRFLPLRIFSNSTKFRFKRILLTSPPIFSLLFIFLFCFRFVFGRKEGRIEVCFPRESRRVPRPFPKRNARAKVNVFNLSLEKPTFHYFVRAKFFVLDDDRGPQASEINRLLVASEVHAQSSNERIAVHSQR